MTKPATSRHRGLWLAAALLMLAEFLLFDRMTARHHASIYPRWNDQIQYLFDAYTAWDRVQADGLLVGLKQTFTRITVQGTLHDFCALPMFWLSGGASRSAALSLNMLVFLAWQAATLFTLLRVTGSRVLAWMGFGLLLCLAYPWSAEAGSAVDFRLDHAAMCLFGMTACAAWLTEGFRRLGWSLAFGLAVGITLLERFLTGAYFAPIFALFALWLLFNREDRWLRVRNLCLAGGVAATLALPVFWFHREGIYGYYWIGHVTGAESAARLRGFDLLQSLDFLVGSFGRQQLGAWFGWTAGGLTALLLLFSRLHPRQPAERPAFDGLIIGLAFLLLPAAILTVHRQKSEVVLGILAPGFVLLVLWLWQVLWRRIGFSPDHRQTRLLAALPAIAALGAGGGYFIARQVPSPHSPEFLASAQKIKQISEYIYQAVRERNLAQPAVGIDRIVDFLDGRILRVTLYERHHVWVPFGLHLPDSILEGPDEAVLFKLRESDFMILTDYSSHEPYWPYEKQMWRLYHELKPWCEEHMTVIDNFQAFGREMTLYQRRPEPPLP